MQLTDEQVQTIKDLRAEVEALDVQADSVFAGLLDKDADWAHLFQQVNAIEGERVMKELIAYVPKKGDATVASLVSKIKKLKGERHLTDTQQRHLDVMEARLDTINSINEWRESLGLPPLERFPRSVPGDGKECAIARAVVTNFNDFRNIQSVSVGTDADIRWTEHRLPTEDDYIESWMTPDEDGKYYFEVETSRTFGDQSHFINKFDDYEMPDLVDDAHITGGVMRIASDLVSIIEAYSPNCHSEHPELIQPKLETLNGLLAECKRRIDNDDWDGSMGKDEFMRRLDKVTGDYDQHWYKRYITFDMDKFVASVDI